MKETRGVSCDHGLAALGTYQILCYTKCEACFLRFSQRVRALENSRRAARDFGEPNDSEGGQSGTSDEDIRYPSTRKLRKGSGPQCPSLAVSLPRADNSLIFELTCFRGARSMARPCFLHNIRDNRNVHVVVDPFEMILWRRRGGGNNNVRSVSQAYQQRLARSTGSFRSSGFRDLTCDSKPAFIIAPLQTAT